MSDQTTTIVEPVKTIVIPSPGTGGDKPLDAALAASMEATLEKRAEKVGATVAEKAKPADKAHESNPIAELRKSRDEVIEKLKTQETAVKERDSQLTELRAQLAEFEGTRKERDELKTQIHSVVKERDSLKKLESKSALEESEPFQEKFVRGEQKNIERLRELAVLADIAPDELLSVIEKTGKAHVQAMDEILGNASSYVGQDIVQTVKAIQALRAERSEQLARADEVMQQRIAERTQSERQKADERSQVRTKAWESVAPALAKELGLKDEQVSEAETFFKTNKDAGKSAEMLLRAQAQKTAEARVKELETELAKYDGAKLKIEADLRGEIARQDPKAARAKLSEEAREILGR